MDFWTPLHKEVLLNTDQYSPEPAASSAHAPQSTLQGTMQGSSAAGGSRPEEQQTPEIRGHQAAVLTNKTRKAMPCY